MREALTTSVLIVAGLACVATVMGRFARRAWLCELASHFRVQYAWILLASAGCLAWARRFPEALLAAGVALIHVRAIVPLYAKPGSLRSHGRPFRALLANVFWANRSYEAVHRLIREAQPDLIVLTEITEAWLAALRGLQREYPFFKVVLRAKGVGGLLLCSRALVTQTEVVRIRKAGLLSIVAHLRLQERDLTVIGAHPHSPISPIRLRLRNRQLVELARLARQHRGPLMVLGDLNTTSWSPAFQDFLRTTQLRDSRIGFGPQPTWPVRLPFARIPLDHCLVSRDVVVRRRRIGPDIGSDHYPVIVDCAL